MLVLKIIAALYYSSGNWKYIVTLKRISNSYELINKDKMKWYLWYKPCKWNPGKLWEWNEKSV